MAAVAPEPLDPQPFPMTTFENDSGYDELVVVRDLAFRSSSARREFLGLVLRPRGRRGPR